MQGSANLHWRLHASAHKPVRRASVVVDELLVEDLKVSKSDGASDERCRWQVAPCGSGLWDFLSIKPPACETHFDHLVSESLASRSLALVLSTSFVNCQNERKGRKGSGLFFCGKRTACTSCTTLVPWLALVFRLCIETSTCAKQRKAQSWTEMWALIVRPHSLSR